MLCGSGEDPIRSLFGFVIESAPENAIEAEESGLVRGLRTPLSDTRPEMP